MTALKDAVQACLTKKKEVEKQIAEYYRKIGQIKKAPSPDTIDRLRADLDRLSTEIRNHFLAGAAWETIAQSESNVSRQLMESMMAEEMRMLHETVEREFKGYGATFHFDNEPQQSPTDPIRIRNFSFKVAEQQKSGLFGKKWVTIAELKIFLGSKTVEGEIAPDAFHGPFKTKMMQLLNELALRQKFAMQVR